MPTSSQPAVLPVVICGARGILVGALALVVLAFVLLGTEG